MDEIFDMLEEERLPGSSGCAVATQESSRVITNYANGTLNKYNEFSNLSDMKFDPQVVDAIAGFLTNTIEQTMNRKFHENLSLLEQNGLIRQEKFEYHKKNVVMAKQLTGIGVYAAFSLAPIICETIERHLSKNEFIDFIVGAYAYINRELTPLIIDNIVNLLLQMNISATKQKVQSIFEKYSKSNGISQIPVFSKRNRNIFGYGGMDILAKSIVSRCDLHEIDTNNRAMEFIEDFLNMDSITARRLISDSKYSQEALSDMIWFSAISYKYIFSDFIKDISNVKQFAFYDINNDPYKQMRDTRKDEMQSIIDEASSKKGLFLTNQKRKDIIEASAKLMQYSLNPSYDIRVDMKMIKRKREIMKLYEI